MLTHGAEGSGTDVSELSALAENLNRGDGEIRPDLDTDRDFVQKVLFSGSIRARSLFSCTFGACVVPSLRTTRTVRTSLDPGLVDSTGHSPVSEALCFAAFHVRRSNSNVPGLTSVRSPYVSLNSTTRDASSSSDMTGVGRSKVLE